MTGPNRRNAWLVGAVLLTLGAADGTAAAQPLTVVELFTSQGCSSCPPANANLIKVKDRPGVLALSFNVTYWDYLGWKDTFGREEFTQRQVSYEPSLGRSGPFTPQVVVNGKADAVGAAPGEIEGLIDAAASRKGRRCRSTAAGSRSAPARRLPATPTSGWCATTRASSRCRWRAVKTPAAPAARQRRPFATQARKLERRGEDTATAGGRRRPEHRGAAAVAGRRADPGRRRQLNIF